MERPALHPQPRVRVDVTQGGDSLGSRLPLDAHRVTLGATGLTLRRLMDGNGGGKGANGRTKSPARMAPAFLLDGSSGLPLHRQLYEAVRGAVLEGRLLPGARLPSGRALSLHLDLSRNTVTTALNQLCAEGYVESRRGSGCYVSPDAPQRPVVGIPSSARGASESSAGRARLSRRARVFIDLPFPFDFNGAPMEVAPFRLGIPALDVFPAEIWGKLLRRRWETSSAALLRPRDARGYRPLRCALADYLADMRGVRCEPDQIVIVAGTQQAFSLLSTLLTDPGDRVWIEDPGYVAMRSALLASGADPVPIAVDSDGLDVAEGLRRTPDARVAFVTPSCQFPLLVTMSVARRRELLAWAREAGSYVVEDDYDSELRYRGRVLPSLWSLDDAERVVYVGTFSKVLSPSLRVGYVVLPTALVRPFVRAKLLSDVFSPPLEQAVLSDFVREGHFVRHLRRMRVLYAKRQEALLELARATLGGRLELEGAPAGMHLVAWLPAEADDRALARRIGELGVHAQSLSFCRSGATGRPALLLGYAGVPIPRMRTALEVVRVALDEGDFDRSRPETRAPRLDPPAGP